MNTMINTTSKPGLSIRELTLIGVMTAVTCILGPFSIPIFISPVPVTLVTFALCLSVYVLGMKKSMISYLIYFLLGAVGLPVFSGFSGGLGKLAGPTGGYLIGFFFMMPIIGYFVDRFHGRRTWALIGMILGTLSYYVFGTIWLAHQLSISFLAGLGVGAFPYLIGDAAKIIMVLIIGPPLRKAISHL